MRNWGLLNNEDNNDNDKNEEGFITELKRQELYTYNNTDFIFLSLQIFVFDFYRGDNYAQVERAGEFPLFQIIIKHYLI